MQAITWKLLLRDCPEIAALVTDCESIIRHERWPWYSRWLGDSASFAVRSMRRRGSWVATRAMFAA